MGLIYYTQLTLTNYDLSLYIQRKQSPQRSVENPTGICRGLIINDGLTDTYEKCVSPELQFSTTPSHQKLNESKIFKKHFKKKTREQHLLLPKSQ